MTRNNMLVMIAGAVLVIIVAIAFSINRSAQTAGTPATPAAQQGSGTTSGTGGATK